MRYITTLSVLVFSLITIPSSGLESKPYTVYCLNFTYCVYKSPVNPYSIYRISRNIVEVRERVSVPRFAGDF